MAGKNESSRQVKATLPGWNESICLGCEARCTVYHMTDAVSQDFIDKCHRKYPVKKPIKHHGRILTLDEL